MMKRIRSQQQQDIRGVRLRRTFGPPMASVLVQIQADAPLSTRDDFAVCVDGKPLAEHQCEWAQVDEQSILLIVHGDAFPWVTSRKSRSRLELVRQGDMLFSETIDVEGFQADGC